MTYYELTPAYRKDYQSAKEVRKAWEDGKDFVGDFQLGFKLVNKQDIPKPCTVQLRYKALQQCILVNVPKPENSVK